MSDTRAQVVLDGDVGPLRQKLRDASQHWQSFSKDVGSGAGAAMGPLEALRGKFLALTAVLAGGALFGKAIKETADYSNQSIQLGKALGDSAGEASVWVNVLADAGASTEEFSGAARGLLKNLMDDERGLNAMGLATRDAGGQLRNMNALMLDAINVVNDHKEGTDRNVAARQVFGKSVDASSALLKINTESVAENRELMERLGLVVGKNQVDNYKRYDDAMDKSALVMKAFSTSIGNAVMPVLTKLGEWFVATGPYAVTALKWSIGVLVSAFWGLKNSVTIAWEALNGLVVTMTEPLRALASAFYKLLTGDLKGAQEELMGWPERVGKTWENAFARMVESSQEARERIVGLFVDGPAADPTKTGGRSATPGKKEEAKAPGSLMQYYELALAEDKRLAAERDATREYTKEQELAYWRWLLESELIHGNDRMAIERKVAQLTVEVRRKSAEEQKAVNAEMVRNAEELELGALESKRAATAAALTLGQLTHAEFLKLELQYEDQRYEIQRQALLDRKQLLSEDPTISPAALERLHSELLLLEQDYQRRRDGIVNQRPPISEKAKTANNIGEGFASTFSSEFEKTLLGAQSWQQSMSNIFRQTGEIFVREVVTKPLQQFLANQARLLAVRLGFMTQEEAAQLGSSGKIAATKNTEAVTVVTANAAEAGSGAASSLASIPYVGPVLAMAAMAAMVATVMKLTGNLKSARGGYDIPSGVDPMTQLHEEEMVLPAKFANVIRGLADGGQRRDQPPPPIEFRGVSAGEFYISTRRDLATTIERIYRDFGFKGAPI